MKTAKTDYQNGFAVVEVVLIAIIAVAVIGIGYWVYQQRNNTSTQKETTTSVKKVKNTTTQTVTSDLNQELNSETKIDEDSFTNEASINDSELQTISGIGDSANAANL